MAISTISLRQNKFEAKNSVSFAISWFIFRFGKPCVIDMMEVDMWHAVERRFDDVTEGLLASMMDKSIMEEEK